MTGRFSWTTAAKIAWRESRASAVKFGFVIAAVAVGVGSLTGVRGFSTAFHTMLFREARTLMGADMTARVFVMPSEEQEAVLEDLRKRGVRETQITETLTMVSAPKAEAPVLVSAKAVDPGVYPFYGAITLEPPAPLSEALKGNNVGLSEDLAVRLGISPGETVRLGGQEFRVSGIVKAETDRMTGSLNIGPRLLISREAMERTGLLGPGSRAAQRFLFKLGPQTPDVTEVRGIVAKAFPDALIVDFRETHPRITTGLDRSTRFLSLVSLIALIVGALGVGTAMHSHLQQKLDSIAIMKCLGARSSQVIRIYLIQTLGLGLLGGCLGISVGAAVQLAFPHLIARYFQVQPGFLWDWTSIAQGLIAGLLCTLLFTAPPLMAIRRIRPNLILRREMADARASWRARWRENKASILLAVGILVGVGLLAAWLAGGNPKEAAQLAAYFTGGITVSLLLLAGVAAALLAGLRRLVKVRALPMSWRHGMANLYRPGNQARAVLVALGIGVMFTLTIYLVQRTILEDIVASAPPGMPNVYLIDIQPAQRDGVLAVLKQQPGMEREPQLYPSVAARLISVDGVPLEQREIVSARRTRQTVSVSWEKSLPEGTKILKGKWWTDPTAGQVAVGRWTADQLKIEPGAKLEFLIADRPVTAQVAAVYTMEALRNRPQYEYMFTPATLEGFPAVYFGGMRMKPSDVPALQRQMFQQFPTVSVINVADVVQTVQEVVDQIALVIRFISAFAILAGAVILGASVAGTRFRRIREVVILKTLGGTKRKIGRIFSAEFLILGAVAGLMGALLASGFSNVILNRFFEAQWRFNALPAIVAVIASALIANVAGWAASAKILGQKPLEALRAE